MLGNIHQLHAETQIWLIGTIALHSLIPGHTQELSRNLSIQSLLENLTHHTFHHGKNGFLIYEGHLNIQLSKLRLTICTEILIAEAAYNLEILLHTRNHQNLLVNLRRLWQSIELTWVQTAWYQEVTGTLWGGLTKHRSLNLQEAIAVKVVTHNLGNTMTKHEILLHLWTTEIQITILQTKHLINLNTILNVEWRSLGRVQNTQLLYHNLNHTGFHIRIYSFLRTCSYVTANSYYKLITNGFSLVESFLTNSRLVNNNLHQTRAITEIHKNQSTVVTTTGNPAAQNYFTAYMVSSQLTAMMGTLQTF